MKEDIRDFAEAHTRMHATPAQLPACLAEVWKKLQKFSIDDPMSFYELTASLQAMFTFPKAHAVEEGPQLGREAQLIPAPPWRDAIISEGFASFDEGKFIIHDLVYTVFVDYVLPPRKTQPPAPAPTPAPVKFRVVDDKKKGKRKK